MNAKDAADITGQLKQTAAQVKAERGLCSASTVSQEPGLSSYVAGRRWFLVLLVALLHVFLAPMGFLPYLGAGEVQAAFRPSQPRAWLLWLVLAGTFVVEHIPHSKGFMKWVRFLLASVQGFGFGRCIVFDFSTLLFRFVIAVCLGIANAYDQLSRIKKVKRHMCNSPVQCSAGAQGNFVDSKGNSRDVEVAEVHEDGQVTVSFAAGWTGKTQGKERVRSDDSRLQLTHYSKEKIDALVAQAERSPGFETRPWGFCVGVTTALWTTEGLGKSDSFVSGVLSGQLLFFATIPVTMYVVWWAWKKSKHPVVRALCLLIFIGACVFDFIAALPVTIGVVGFGTTELLTHQIVVYIAIPVDYLVFLKKAKTLSTHSTLEDVATLGLKHVVRKADRMLPEDVKVPLLR